MARVADTPHISRRRRAPAATLIAGALFVSAGTAACNRTPVPNARVDSAIPTAPGAATTDGGSPPDAGDRAAGLAPVDALLARIEKPCAPCGAERAADLFELASLLTSLDRADATDARVTQAARLCLAALGDPHEEFRTEGRQVVVETALASLGALAATLPAARDALQAAGAAAKIRALIEEEPARTPDGGAPAADAGTGDGGEPGARVRLREPTQREHARSLLVLGALFQAGAARPPAAKGRDDRDDREGRDKDRALLRAGLLDPRRLVQRQAVLGATLARDEALDPPMLASLRRLLGPRSDKDRDDVQADAAAELARLTIPATLPPAVLGELLPLLPAYTDLLLSLPGSEGSAAALRLLQAAVRGAPQSGTARFFLAQVLSARKDPAALAELRAALALGNLPSTFADSLGPSGQALVEKPNPTQARAEVRRLLALRKPAAADAATRRVTLKVLDSGEVRFRTVAPRALEQRAQAVLASPDAGGREALQLGAELFATYPFRSEEYYDSCLRSFLSGNNRDLLDPLGLQHEEASPERRVVVGIVRTTEPAADLLPRGAPASPTARPGEPRERYGVTCAICHAHVDADGRRWDGLPARAYDPGLLLAACVDQPIHYKAGNRNLVELMDYRPGRNDSTSDGVHNPTDIPSLLGLRVRGPVRWNGDLPALELQIDHNLSQHAAPPAVIALVAAYLRALPLPPVAPAPAAPDDGAAQPVKPGPAAAPPNAELVGQGEAVFTRACQRCHQGSAYTSGQVVPLAQLGTDATRISAVLPNSTEGYKVPSLLRLLRTAPYLHDGSVPSIEALLELGGAHRPPGTGHRFGLELPLRDRVALAAFLRTR